MHLNSAMIRTRSDLREYIYEDSKNFYRRMPNMLTRIKSRIFSTPINDQSKIWAYIRTLRLCEYYHNHSNRIVRVLGNLLYCHKLRTLSRITGFQIPPNTLGKGLTIWHWGTIIISDDSRIGDYCTLEPGVVVGSKIDYGRAPVIGNHVTINGGSRIIGDITIGDDVIIGANTVVLKNTPPLHCCR